MSPNCLLRQRVCRLFLIFTAALAVASVCRATGTWTTIASPAPGNVELMLLLSDGTVMAKDAGTNNAAWYRLTPDVHGSYINGTWSTLAPMNFTREFFSSAVLPDGRVFVAGGEYGTGGSTVEIYDAKSNAWTIVPVPPGLICTNCGAPGFSDAGSVVLPNGNVLVAPVSIAASGGTVIYNPASNTFVAGPSALADQNEATWVKLPDDSILTIDPTNNSSALNTSERFIPSLNNGQGGWIADATLPVAMYNSSTEIGAGLLLPDGRAFFIGGNGQTAYYTPSGNTNKGTWAAGPTLVSPGVGWDEPAAVMVNGKVLLQTVLGPPATPQPRGFYEMDPTVNYPIGSITETPEWGDNSGTSHIMLNLPDGNVLVSYGSATVRVYQPDGLPVAAGKPVITSLRFNLDGSFHLSGTQFNGISQGSSFGDDAQMDSNYPLVRFLADSGEVTYARTFNWSSTSVRTSNQVVSTEFTMPASLAGTGTFHLQAVANGIASDPLSFLSVAPAATLTFGGSSSMGISFYDILGGVTVLQDDGSASGILLRTNGGILQLSNSATAGTAAIRVEGGMGDGGLPGHLVFHDNSTAGGADILNRPGVLGPNFKNASPNPTDGFAGETRFFDNSKAGTARISNDGEIDAGASSGGGGYTAFAGNSSADHATFITRGATYSNGRGGRVDFTGNSTADHGTFTNLNSNNGSQYSQGRTVFFDTTTGGQGLFVNVGGDGGFLETGGTTEFRANSSAGNATIINQGPTGGNFPQPGKTQFFDTASAGNAIITNKTGASTGGGTEFFGHSTAGTAYLVTDGSSPVPANLGTITFKEDSVAGQANFRVAGVYGGNISFNDRASADHGTFLLDPNLNNARVQFYGTSTASNAAFEIGGGAYLQFFDSTTAGNATIVLRGNGGAQSVGGFGGGTAGNASITVMGAEVPGGAGGNLGFQSPGTAGNATITINGAAVTTFGASGGVVGFDYSASAGTATFIVNGGSNGGAGGQLTFGRGGSADQATVVVNAGGTLDVAGNAYYNGTGVGSLAGAGNVYLGFAAMTVGGLNTDTTFSGVTSDLGSPGYYGTLTKIGLGTLKLAGTNTYKGLTTVAAGTLVVNGAVAGDVQVNGGAVLKGSGKIGGSVTVAPGGKVAPGNSPGTLLVQSNYSQAAQAALEMEVAGPNPVNRDLLSVQGNANLSGTLLLVFSGYAPSAGESFPLVQAGGTLTVSNLNLIVLGLKQGVAPTYQVTAGQLVITVGTSGQLRTATDPIQALSPWYSPQTGFVYTVFAVTGQTYQFDTSTDFRNWTPVSTFPGANALHEFRFNPPAGDAVRFFRVGQH